MFVFKIHKYHISYTNIHTSVIPYRFSSLNFIDSGVYDSKKHHSCKFEMTESLKVHTLCNNKWYQWYDMLPRGLT